MESPSPSPARHAAGVPLMSEINDLIEKERTLLELRLLDKKLEAEEWKAKYDSLKNKLTAEEEDGDLQAALAFNEDYDPQVLQTASMRDIVINRLQGNLADLNRLQFAPGLFANVCKVLFGVKTSYPDLRIIWLKGCGLAHADSTALAHLLRSAQTTAVDLSANDLHDASFVNIIEVLKNRKHTPQYLLFDGNPLGAHAATLFCTLLQHLSESTWGLAVSLPDQLPLPSEAADRAAARKANRPTNLPGDNAGYKDLVKHPNASAAFLSSLAAILTAHKEQAGVRTKAQQKGSAGGGRAANGLQALHCLAMTGCQLSKRSLQGLEACLPLLLPSLTDLDLSFAYAGQHLAQVLAAVLGKTDCMLIRLGLRGNLLGDGGACLLLGAMTNSCTLTHCDLSHNCLTSLTLTKLLSLIPSPACEVLNVLDLSCNDLAQGEGVADAVLQEVRHKVRAHGLGLLVKVDEHSARAPETQMALDEPRSLFVRLAMKQHSVRGRTCIQRIDLTRMMTSTTSKLIRISFTLVAQQNAVISWEVATLQKEQRTVLFQSSPITTSPCRCSVVLCCPPSTGHLSIDLRPSSSSCRVQSSHLTVTAIDLLAAPWQLLGGDGDCDTVSLAACQAQAVGELGDELQLLRMMRYACSGPRAKLRWQAKLTAQREMPASKAKALGYEMCLYKLSSRGQVLLMTIPMGSDAADPLIAWKDQAYELEVQGLRYGDRLLLAARVLSAAKVPGVCVVATGCQLLTFAGDLLDKQLPADEMSLRLPLCCDPNEIYSV